MPVLIVPRIIQETNLPLRWGEWFGIAVSSSIGLALALEVLFILGAMSWFGDANRALIHLGPLLLALLVAALIMRLPESFPALERIERGLLVGGIVLTALILIRTLVFPRLALTDLSWLASFGSLTDLYAETPHAELGMIAMSVVIWLHALAIVRNGGDYEARRRHFIRVLLVMIAAIVLALITISDKTAVSENIALYLPGYTLVGLITLSQVRLAEVRARMARTGSGDRRTLGVWRLVTAGLALISLLIVFITTAIFYRGSYERAIAAALTIWGFFVDAIATVLGWLSYPVIVVLKNVTDRFPATPCVPPTETPDASGLLTPTPTSLPGPQPSPMPTGQSHPCRTLTTPISGQAPAPVSADVAHIFLIVALLIVLIVVGLVLAQRLKRRRAAGSGDDFEEEREGLNIRAVLREQFARSTPRAAAVIDVPAPGTARAAYRTFLSNAARAGHARQSTETPEEFQRRLRPVLDAPATDPPVKELTQGYEAERYGGERLPAGLLARVQEAVRALASVFARLPHPRTKQGKEEIGP